MSINNPLNLKSEGVTRMNIQDQINILKTVAWNVLFNHIERDRIKTFGNMRYWQRLGQEKFGEMKRIFPHLKITDDEYQDWCDDEIRERI